MPFFWHKIMFLVCTVKRTKYKYCHFYVGHVLDGVRLLPSQNLIGNTSGEEDFKKNQN